MKNVRETLKEPQGKRFTCSGQYRSQYRLSCLSWGTAPYTRSSAGTRPCLYYHGDLPRSARRLGQAFWRSSVRGLCQHNSGVIAYKDGVLGVYFFFLPALLMTWFMHAYIFVDPWGFRRPAISLWILLDTAFSLLCAPIILPFGGSNEMFPSRSCSIYRFTGISARKPPLLLHYGSLISATL